MRSRTCSTAKFWRNRFYQPQDYLWQPTLFQPVGGMDQIVKGFLRKVGKLIRLQRRGHEDRDATDGVEVTYRKPDGGQATKPRAPRRLLHQQHPDAGARTASKAELLQRVRDAVDQVRFTRGCKVGWQANKRFWETTEPDLRRHQLDRPPHRADVVPVERLLLQEGHADGRVHPGRHKADGLPSATTRPAVFGELSLAERLEDRPRGGQQAAPRDR